MVTFTPDFLLHFYLCSGILKITQNSDSSQTDAFMMNDEKKLNIKAVITGWLVDTFGSFTAGILIGIVVVAIMASKGMAQNQMEEELFNSKAFYNISLFVSFSFTFIGGYVSAFIARADELKHAFMTGALSLITSLLLTSVLTPQPHGTSSYLILTFVIPFAVLGGYLRKTTKKETKDTARKSNTI